MAKTHFHYGCSPDSVLDSSGESVNRRHPKFGRKILILPDTSIPCGILVIRDSARIGIVSRSEKSAKCGLRFPYILRPKRLRASVRTIQVHPICSDLPPLANQIHNAMKPESFKWQSRIWAPLVEFVRRRRQRTTQNCRGIAEQDRRPICHTAPDRSMSCGE